MTQSSPTIGANKSGLTYRQEDNDGKKALLNHHKASSAPSYAEAGTIWLDDAATPWTLKIHDGTDWIKIADVNASTNAVTPYLGTGQIKLLNYASDTGSATAYAVAPVPAIASYTAGQMVVLKPGNNNSGASTLAVCGLSATAVKMPDGSDTAAGVMKTSGIYLLVHNGTHFILLNPTKSDGSIIDRAYASYTSNASLSTIMPIDDTIPQNTEGTEILSASLTPKSATSRIRVRFTGYCSPNSVTHTGAALFIDSGASAVQGAVVTHAGSSSPQQISFEYEYVPGDASAHTYKVRVGPETGTMRMNGTSAGRYFGGISAATLVVQEITP